MKMMVFYRPVSEHARKTESYIQDLKRQHGLEDSKIEYVDIDTREGWSSSKVYDVVAYPSILVTDDNGIVMKMWSGELPLQNELMSYLFTS